jgi:hypothetical protein
LTVILVAIAGHARPANAGERDLAPERLPSIAAWLAANFELPPPQSMPNVGFVSQERLELRRYGRVLNARQQDGTAGLSHANQNPSSQQQRSLIAIYEDATQTIYLSDRWEGSSLADQSVLVHEMVHHLQYQAGIRYACGGARERPAYLAQKKWLEINELSLEREFDVDMFTIVAMSACI